VGSPFELSAPGAAATGPALAAGDGGLLAAWEQKGAATDVFARPIGADGPSGAAVPVASTRGIESNPAVAYDGVSGRYIVAWRDGRQSGASFAYRFATARAVPATRPVFVDADGDLAGPTLACTGGSCLLVGIANRVAVAHLAPGRTAGGLAPSRQPVSLAPGPPPMTCVLPAAGAG
jgi:hypothetical protein